MYNTAGVWEKQEISLGHLKDGKAGYFTGGFLVKCLTDAEHAQPTEQHQEYAQRNNYTFVEGEGI